MFDLFVSSQNVYTIITAGGHTNDTAVFGYRLVSYV